MLLKALGSNLTILLTLFRKFNFPPASVPTAITDTICPSLRKSSAAFRLAAFWLTPSAINKTWPFTIPACFNNSCALTKPKSALLPCAGIICGVSTFNNERMVSVSLVSGDAVKASPANNTRPVWPSSSRDKISSILNRARANRLGFRSSMSIELDKSNTSTRAAFV